MSNNKWYGSLDARLAEGKNYLGRKELRSGDDITMYYYSDQHCYYIDEVISQKEIKVKQYYVCADHSKKDLGCGHQEWLYFKTLKEHDDYIKTVNPRTQLNYEGEPEAMTWVYRYGKWQEKLVYNKTIINNIIKRDGYCIFKIRNEKEQKLLDEGKDVIRYRDLNGKISFGIRDYYYDWTF